MYVVVPSETLVLPNKIHGASYLRNCAINSVMLQYSFKYEAELWMFVCCECFVLSGRGLCDGLITRPEESYGLWRVGVCDQETSYARRL